ncbi:MAG: endolytic transglycosylase MltG [Defluviitaleaceae bacterium]|nr:endolytic transglycosylase MltG [Defluviitaleaceae bacterium]
MKADKTVNFLMYIAGMAFNVSIMVLVGFLIILAFGEGFNIGEELATDMTTVGEDYEMEFVILADTPSADIAQRLFDQGIVANKMLYQLELFFRKSTHDYAAGTFTINTSMNNVEINRALRARPQELAPYLTIQTIEGQTLEDMAKYFEEREFFTAEEFMYVAQNGHFSFQFLLDVPTDRPNRLEGYLFPDTYQIPVNPNPGDIITRMLDNFANKFTDAFHIRADEMGLSIDEVVKIASIIERETRLAAERPMVSQVIHRRLDQKIRLEMCSTVQYVMDDPPVRLLYEHLEIDSPYNTYKNSGLPIGPIANPGIAAIEAALWPSDGDYLYFVLKDESTGEHQFSRTLEQHNAASALYGG